MGGLLRATMAAMPASIVDQPLYGASLEGVQDWLPTFRITDSSTPNATQVDAFLVFTSRWVRNRFGPLDGYSDDIRSWAEDNARGLVEVGAASRAYNAAHPGAADKAGAYGTELWAMFLKGIDETLETLGKMVDEGKGVPLVDEATAPAAYFPPPRFWRDQGF